MPIRTRFAPSPNGRLHIGHLASALFVWNYAERNGAEVLLRIEDTDTSRCKPEFTKLIFEDLDWLGLEWPEPVRIQSKHFADYQSVQDNLLNRGFLYRCFKSRSEISLLTQGKPYVGKALKPSQEQILLESGRPYSWRLSLDAVREEIGSIWNELDYRISNGALCYRRPASPAIHGDIVVSGKDSPTSYHVAATHDDAIQGITHVIRGMDLADAPHIHRLLQILLGWPEPTYIHHSLIVDAEGKKLSKRDKAPSIDSLKNENTALSVLKHKLHLKIIS